MTALRRPRPMPHWYVRGRYNKTGVVRSAKGDFWRNTRAPKCFYAKWSKVELIRVERVVHQSSERVWSGRPAQGVWGIKRVEWNTLRRPIRAPGYSTRRLRSVARSS